MTELVASASAGAALLRAVGALPAIVTFTGVAVADAVSAAHHVAIRAGAERYVTLLAGVAARAGALAVDAGAVCAAADRAGWRRAVVRAPAVITLAHACGTAIAEAPPVAAAAIRACELRTVVAAVAAAAHAHAVRTAGAAARAVVGARAQLAAGTLEATLAMADAVEAKATAIAVVRRRARAALAAWAGKAGGALTLEARVDRIKPAFARLASADALSAARAAERTAANAAVGALPAGVALAPRTTERAAADTAAEAVVRARGFLALGSREARRA